MAMIMCMLQSSRNVYLPDERYAQLNLAAGEVAWQQKQAIRRIIMSIIFESSLPAFVPHAMLCYLQVQVKSTVGSSIAHNTIHPSISCIFAM